MEHENIRGETNPEVHQFLDFMYERQGPEIVAFHGVLHLRASRRGNLRWQQKYGNFLEALALLPQDSHDVPELAGNVYQSFADTDDELSMMTVLAFLPKLWPTNQDTTVRIMRTGLLWRPDTESGQAIRSSADFVRQKLEEASNLLFLLPRPQALRPAVM